MLFIFLFDLPIRFATSPLQPYGASSCPNLPSASCLLTVISPLNAPRFLTHLLHSSFAVLDLVLSFLGFFSEPSQRCANWNTQWRHFSMAWLSHVWLRLISALTIHFEERCKKSSPQACAPCLAAGEIWSFVLMVWVDDLFYLKDLMRAFSVFVRFIRSMNLSRM